MQKLFSLFVLLLFLSCNSKEGVEKNQDQNKEDKNEVVSNEFKLDSMHNERASIISGSSSYKLDAEATDALKRLDQNWKESVLKMFAPVSQWNKQEKIEDKIGSHYGVFYPFSGPDLPFAQAFYPGASLYILVGLEKAADTSSIMFAKNPEYKDFILNAEKYFYFSGRMGFFRTADMGRQFSKRGVADILAFYLKKNNCNILSMSYGKWGNDSIVTLEKNQEQNSDVCHLRFQQQDNRVAEVYYFKKDLSDNNLGGDSLWLKWLKRKYEGMKLASLNKSASYLMHNRNFSIVRNFILQNSDLHIQDDTGIGFDYILQSKRPFQLYGKYTRTIARFSGYFNKELLSRYETGNAKPLPFTIGYTSSRGESNLLMMYR